MSRARSVALAACSFVFSAAATGQDGASLPEGNAFVRTALGGARPQDAAINDYSYDLEEMRENLDKNGKATSLETRRYEVYFVKTRPVRRLVAKNGVPLSPKERTKEDQRAEALAKAIAEGRTVSEQPGVRIRLSGLVDALEFKTIGREERSGRKTLVFDFEPRKGSVASGGASRQGFDAVAKVLVGRLHIDEADRRVVLLDARNTPGQKVGVATGVKLGTIELRMEFESVADGVWLPRKVASVVTGRAFLFKTFRVRQTTTYSNYRRFRVDTEEKPVG